MNSIVKKILILSSLALISCFLFSCSDIFAPEDREFANSSEGLVKLYFGSTDAHASPKGFMPDPTSGVGDVQYVVRFIKYAVYPGTVEKELSPLTITGTSIVQSLETGIWDIVVTRNEKVKGAFYPVASATWSNIDVKAGQTYSRQLTLAPAQAGAGFFYYEIKSDLRPLNVRIVLQLKSDGSEQNYFAEIRSSDTGGISATLTVDAGDYRVFVYVSTLDGTKGTGKHSDAVIFPGRVTSSTPDYFSFHSTDFNDKVHLVGSLTIPNNAAMAGDSYTIIAKNPASPYQEIGRRIFDWPADNRWVLYVDQGYASANLRVELQGDDNDDGVNDYVYELDNVPVTGIGVNGKMDDIPLSISILSVAPLTSPGTVTPRREYYSPGQKVTLDVQSAYGIKPGTLVLPSPHNSIVPVRESATVYFFTMPNSNVGAPSAQFYSSRLNSLSVSAGGVNYLSQSSPAVTPYEYEVTVPNNVSAFSVAAVSEDLESIIKIDSVETKSRTYSVTTLTPVSITVRVEPPAGAGGNKSPLYEEYKIKVTRAPSANADLASIKVENGVTNALIAFLDPGASNQTLTVENNISSIRITAVAAAAGAVVTGDGLKILNPLSVDLSDTFPITVIAEDNLPGSTKIYNITVKRKGLATLNDLNIAYIDSGSPVNVSLSPTFNSGVYFYYATVPSNVSQVTVTATPNDSAATLTPVSGSVVNLPVAGGINPASVNVTPQNYVAETDKKTYTIYVTREKVLSSDTTLGSIVLTDGVNSPITISSPTANYTYPTTITVGNDVDAITVSAFPAAGTSQVVSGNNAIIHLAVGIHTYNHIILVKAENTDFAIYSLTFTVDWAGP